MSDQGHEPIAVFDAMIFLQALGNPDGASAACLNLWDAERVRLCVSRAILLEVGDLLTRPAIRSKFLRISDDIVYHVLQRVRAVADFVEQPAHAITLPRDHDDEIYLDLAVAANAHFLVSWNERHLGYLMTGNTPECLTLRRLHPSLRIVTPPEFLRAVRDMTSENSR